MGLLVALWHRAARGGLISLSALALTIAISGVSASSASARTKGVELVIKVRGRPGTDSKRFDIGWRTSCFAGHHERAPLSGSQSFGGSVIRQCGGNEELTYAFELRTGQGESFNGERFQGWALNPHIGRPFIALDRHFHGRILRGHFAEGFGQEIGIGGPNGWQLRFLVKRERDTPFHKRFDLWIWITGP